MTVLRRERELVSKKRTRWRREPSMPRYTHSLKLDWLSARAILVRRSAGKWQKSFLFRIRCSQIMADE
jgi:hypothetical protein